MKKSYNSTLFAPDLTKATIKLFIYEGCKYNDKAECRIPLSEMEYNGITGWDIIEGGKEAEEIESHCDGNCIDEYHEYLVLHLLNGNTATFRNSYVDMFII